VSGLKPPRLFQRDALWRDAAAAERLFTHHDHPVAELGVVILPDVFDLHHGRPLHNHVVHDARADPFAQVRKLPEPAIGFVARRTRDRHCDLVPMDRRFKVGIAVDGLEALEDQIKVLAVDQHGFVSW
jgi:hypothetical protein